LGDTEAGDAQGESIHQSLAGFEVTRVGLPAKARQVLILRGLRQFSERETV